MMGSVILLQKRYYDVITDYYIEEIIEIEFHYLTLYL